MVYNVLDSEALFEYACELERRGCHAMARGILAFLLGERP